MAGPEIVLGRIAVSQLFTHCLVCSLFEPASASGTTQIISLRGQASRRLLVPHWKMSI